MSPLTKEWMQEKPHLTYYQWGFCTPCTRKSGISRAGGTVPQRDCTPAKGHSKHPIEVGAMTAAGALWTHSRDQYAKRQVTILTRIIDPDQQKVALLFTESMWSTWASPDIPLPCCKCEYMQRLWAKNITVTRSWDPSWIKVEITPVIMLRW